MLDQLTYFQDYKKRMKKLVGKKKTKKIVSKGAAIVVAGSNDLVYTYFGNGAQHLKNDVDSFTTMMADSAASFVLVRVTIIDKLYFLLKCKCFIKNDINPNIWAATVWIWSKTYRSDRNTTAWLYTITKSKGQKNL